MSIAALLKAAEYIDRRDRVLLVAEGEHGYASSLPVFEEHRSGGRRTKTKKSQGSRTTHNELEKNRRAHLRTCLEKLKDMVPLGSESSRHTTLGLLTKAKRFIKSLEERDKKNSGYKDQLQREQRFLRRRLLQLRASPSDMRTLSESEIPHTHSSRSDSFSSLESTSSGVSTADRSPSSISESDEVDVIGYTSNQSDSESLVSGHSRDSGVVEARRLSPAHVFSSGHVAGQEARHDNGERARRVSPHTHTRRAPPPPRQRRGSRPQRV